MALSRKSGTLPVLPLEDRYRAKLDFIIGWLVDMNFPFDWQYREPLPAWLRDELAVVWSAREKESVGEMDWAMRCEQQWEDEAHHAA